MPADEKLLNEVMDNIKKAITTTSVDGLSLVRED